MIRSFKGKTPKIAESAFVSEMAYIIGDVKIGEGCGIWPGAVIRGDFASIKINRSCAIEDNCVLHAIAPIEIGSNVIVGHGAIVHGRRIGHNTLIGNNATILDGAEIGDYCLIAAGSVVTEGMKIPDKSFVTGIPAEVKRELTEGQKKRLEADFRSYAELTRLYKENEPQ